MVEVNSCASTGHATTNVLLLFFFDIFSREDAATVAILTPGTLVAFVRDMD